MTLLPEPFVELEPLVAEWALGSEAQRNYKRRNSDMQVLHDFYNALLPRMEALAEYLRPLAIDQFSDEQKNLYDLALMFMEMSLSIENFRSPDVPGGFDPDRFHILPPYAQTAAGVRQQRN